MITSLSKKDLQKYLLQQLVNFFPDNKSYDSIFNALVEKTLVKLEFNFQHVKLSYFWKSDTVYFNHLNADQYAVFIYYASNIAFEDLKNEELASKLFYLNKILHSFHCMYNTKLPDIFLIIHGTGIVLGKANYSNYFVVTQGTTVGSNSQWQSPTLGERLVMYPNSSIIGDSNIGLSSCISNGSLLIDTNTKFNSLIIGNSPNLIIKQQNKCKSRIYFKD